jgi:hypothetical protein
MFGSTVNAKSTFVCEFGVTVRTCHEGLRILSGLLASQRFGTDHMMDKPPVNSHESESPLTFKWFIAFRTANDPSLGRFNHRSGFRLEDLSDLPFKGRGCFEFRHWILLFPGFFTVFT